MALHEELTAKAQKISIKVQDGTVSAGPLLCGSCTRGLVRKSEEGKQTVMCAWAYNSPVYIKEKIVQCTGYRNRAAPSLESFEEIAWQIITNKREGSLGFIDPQEWRRRIKDEK